MILTAFFTFLFNFFDFVFSGVPTSFTIPQEWFDAFNYVWGILNGFSWIVPIQTLLTVLGLAISFHILVFLIRLVSWVLRKVPGVN